MEYPLELTKQLKELLQEEYGSFMTAMGDSPHGGLRLHSQKRRGGEETLLGLTKKVPWTAYGYYTEDSSLAKHPFYHGGIFYLQEPSAMLPAEVLAPKKGDWVLDLCAAPGGKATRLSEFLNGTGFLVANDISNSRCKGLLRNLELFGMSNAVVTNETPARLAHQFGAVFNKVLVDAPCSGQGMFRKDTRLLKEYIERKDRDFPRWQRDILNAAASLTALGGEIVYSTCTFTKDENEEIIACFLREHTDFFLLDIPKEHGFVGGADGMTEAVHLYPHRVQGEGHFAAHLQRRGVRKEKPCLASADAAEIGAEVFSAFCRDHGFTPPQGKVIAHHNRLSLRTFDFPELKGLKVVGAGTFLGDMKNGRFQPSHPLALSLKKEQVENPLCFPYDSKEIRDYLKGLTLNIDAPKGYHIIFANNFPMGWVKSDGRGTLKNHYPKVWRNL